MLQAGNEKALIDVAELGLTLPQIVLELPDLT